MRLLGAGVVALAAVAASLPAMTALERRNPPTARPTVGGADGRDSSAANRAAPRTESRTAGVRDVQAAYTTGQIVEFRSAVAADRCLDVPGVSHVAPTRISIYACENTPQYTAHQQRYRWEATSGLIKVYENDGSGQVRCVDVFGNNRTLGAHVGIWYCEGGPSQRWEPALNGTAIRLVGPENLCLDVPGANPNPGPGGGLSLWHCAGEVAQTWTARPLGAGGVTSLHTMHSTAQISEVRSAVAADRCLDVPGVSHVAPSRISIYACENSAQFTAPQQRYRWEATTGLIKVYDEPGLGPVRCVDVFGNNRNLEAHVGIWYCEGGPSQRWEPTADGTGIRLVGPENLCLDVPGANPNPGPGGGLSLWHCAGEVAQTWTARPLGPAPPTGLAPPVLSTAAHNGDNRSLALCGATCFELTAGYTTPAYVSMDAPRAVTLAYVGRQAHRTAMVQVDAEDRSATPPDRMSLKLLQPDGQWVTYPNGTTEAFFQAGAGRNRLALRLNFGGAGTGVYNYTAEVTSHWTQAGVRQSARVPVRVLVVNEDASPYGWGWAVAGVPRVHLPTGNRSDPMIAWDGTGTVQYFRNGGCDASGCTYLPPAGEFSTIRYHAAQPEQGVEFVRTYPDGSTVGYEPYGRAVYTADRLGNRTTYAWHDQARLASITDPAGKTTVFGYNGANKLRTITDPGGRVTTVTVNGAGDLDSIVDPAGRTALRAQYDQFHLLNHTWDARGGQTSYWYDLMLRLARVDLPSVVANGASTRPTTAVRVGETAGLIDWWDGTGRGTAGNPTPRVDPDAVRTTVTDARNQTTTLQLDRFAAPLRIEEPLGRTTVIARDAHSRPTRVEGPSGHVVRSAYDGSRLTSTTDEATGATINVAYGSNPHDLPERVYGDVPETHYRYDARWLLDSTWVTGKKATRYTYDARGRVRTVGDPEAHATTYAYEPDGWQNTASVTAANGGVTAFAYNQYGLDTAVTNAKGEASQTQYDAINRVVSTRNGLGHVTRFEYDALYPTAVVDAKGQRYESGPNALGWAEWEKDPHGQLTHHRYDAAGNPTWLQNRRGQQVTFAYDALGQLESRTADNATTAYRTDPRGRWTMTSNAESTDTLFFDAAGRAVREWSRRANGAVYDRTSGYDRQNRRTQLTVGGWSMGYRYDAAGQLDTLVDASGRRTAFGYNADGQRTRVAWPNGVEALTNFPSTHTPSGFNFTSPTVDVALGLGYDPDPLGRLGTRLNFNGTAGRDYSYDAAGRLGGYADFTMASGACQPVYPPGPVLDDPPTQPIYYDCPPDQKAPGASAAYGYDAVGNRTDNGAAVEPGNRLVRFGPYTLQYDADGNLLWKFRDGCPAGQECHDEWIWNSLGQLTRAWRYSDGYVHYGYDGWGRRVRRTHENSGQTTHFVYDGDDLVLQAEPSGHVTHVYTNRPGVDRPHSVVTNAVAYYYQQDAEGNVTGLVDQSGALAATYEYGPFGQVTGTTGGVSQALGYKGREGEPHTGLVYLRARWYDPELGRFLSEDPIGLAGGINPYAFAANDPVNASDPYGLCAAGQEEKTTYTRGEHGTWVETKYCLSGRGNWSMESVGIWGRGSPLGGLFGWGNTSGASANFGNPNARGGSAGLCITMSCIETGVSDFTVIGLARAAGRGAAEEIAGAARGSVRSFSNIIGDTRNELRCLSQQLIGEAGEAAGEAGMIGAADYARRRAARQAVGRAVTAARGAGAGAVGTIGFNAVKCAVTSGR